MIEQGIPGKLWAELAGIKVVVKIAKVRMNTLAIY